MGWGALLWLPGALGEHWRAWTPLLAVPHPNQTLPNPWQSPGRGWQLPNIAACPGVPPQPFPRVPGPVVFTKRGEKNSPGTWEPWSRGSFPHDKITLRSFKGRQKLLALPIAAKPFCSPFAALTPGSPSPRAFTSSGQTFPMDGLSAVPAPGQGSEGCQLCHPVWAGDNHVPAGTW